MNIDYSKCTFLIPFMNSCSDREFNIFTVLNYLNKHLKTNVFVCEQINQNTKMFVINFKNYPNLNIIHHKEQIDDNFIHKTKLYNIALSKIKTEIIATYDCDVLIPIDQMNQSMNYILDMDFDYSYPFDSNNVEISKNFPRERKRLLDTFNFNEYVLNIKKIRTKIPIFRGCPPGGCMFLKRSVYIDIGMENELFVGYAPEDAERKYRLEFLNYKNKNANGYLFHIEHQLPPDGRVVNTKNQQIFNEIKKMNKENLKKYYDFLDYKRKYEIE